MSVGASILLKFFGIKMRLFWSFQKSAILRRYTRLFLRLKFRATSPFSASSESGLIYETTPLLATNWLLGFNKSPTTPDVQLNCNRHKMSYRPVSPCGWIFWNVPRMFLRKWRYQCWTQSDLFKITSLKRSPRHNRWEFWCSMSFTVYKLPFDSSKSNVNFVGDWIPETWTFLLVVVTLMDLFARHFPYTTIRSQHRKLSEWEGILPPLSRFLYLFSYVQFFILKCYIFT